MEWLLRATLTLIMVGLGWVVWTFIHVSLIPESSIRTTVDPTLSEEEAIRFMQSTEDEFGRHRRIYVEKDSLGRDGVELLVKDWGQSGYTLSLRIPTPVESARTVSASAQWMEDASSVWGPVRDVHGGIRMRVLEGDSKRESGVPPRTVLLNYDLTGSKDRREYRMRGLVALQVGPEDSPRAR